MDDIIGGFFGLIIIILLVYFCFRWPWNKSKTYKNIWTKKNEDWLGTKNLTKYDKNWYDKEWFYKNWYNKDWINKYTWTKFWVYRWW